MSNAPKQRRIVSEFVKKSITGLALSVTCVSALEPGNAFAGAIDRVLDVAAASTTVAAIEVGFSPEGTAEHLVLKVIDASRHSIRLAAYSFTSPSVVSALIAARHRGVEVAVIVDEKNNLREDRSGKARAALNLLINAGIPTRTISVYPIHHDKYIVADDEVVETGSFNYSATARSNSENAIVIWHNTSLAKSYVDHWQSRWEQGVPYRSSY